MSDQVPTTFTTEFQNNMRLALNQTQAKSCSLRSRAQRGERHRRREPGRARRHCRAGPEPQGFGRRPPRRRPTHNTPHSRVWIAKPDFDYYADLVDNNDQVQAKIALQSGYMQTAIATINRAKDDAFHAGFFGNMITGATGQTLTPFPAGNVIANDVGGTAGTPIGLNVAKVRAAAKLLGQQFNDSRRSRRT
jgi:hypothetical protein